MWLTKWLKMRGEYTGCPQGKLRLWANSWIIFHQWPHLFSFILHCCKRLLHIVFKTIWHTFQTECWHFSANIMHLWNFWSLFNFFYFQKCFINIVGYWLALAYCCLSNPFHTCADNPKGLYVWLQMCVYTGLDFILPVPEYKAWLSRCVNRAGHCSKDLVGMLMMLLGVRLPHTLFCLLAYFLTLPSILLKSLNICMTRYQIFTRRLLWPKEFTTLISLWAL